MTWKTRLILVGAIAVLFGITYALVDRGPHHPGQFDPFMHWLPVTLTGIFAVVFAIVVVQRVVANRRGMAALQEASW